MRSRRAWVLAWIGCRVEVTEAALSGIFATVVPLLDERQRRVLAGAQARALGRGIALVTRAARMSRTTVRRRSPNQRMAKKSGHVDEDAVRRFDRDPHA